MKIRLNTLKNLLLSQLKVVKKTMVFLLIIAYCPVFSQNGVSEGVKKEASRLFEAEDYTGAYKLYSQLVSNYPKDPEYNYKLGVCMIFSEPDKKKCLPYLQFAAKNKNEATKEVHFYLGKAYHINYLFDEAIKNYNEFRLTAPQARQKKLQVDREIAACGFGKKLLSNLSDLVVKSKKQLNEADYFRSYDLKDIGGKLLMKPDDFKSSADKKKNEVSVVFLPKAGTRIYYSSYGDNADKGKDIYSSVKMADGSYSKPEKVSGINTEFDEDYPFLHPNGQTLYFASKGHNSMGGYDIFKSSYIEASNSWSTPVNLEFPINSPDDDYLYVTDSLEKTAYFSTGRQSPPGKIDVLKISTERKPIDVLAIKGNVEKENEEQSLKSKISIADATSTKPIGIYYAEDNGGYDLELPNGARLMFTVETPGQKTQSQEVALPLATESKPFKQTISYIAGILKITNDFDPASSDDNYLQYLKVIEKKARLDVNEGENTLDAPVAASGAPKKETDGPALQSTTTAGTTPLPATTKDPKQGVDNQQLASIAKQDAMESTQEAARLTQDSKDALEVGNQQKEEAGKKLVTANEALNNAEGIGNEEEKKAAIEKATLLKQEAENADAVANKILAFAKSLDADAIAKKQEAGLNEQYATELEKTINSKSSNKESLAKLEALQKQISDLDNKKNESEDLFNSIKTEITEKEQQMTSLEKTTADVKLNLDEIKSEITAKEEELAKTKKKKEKERIAAETEELKAEQADKERQIAVNDTEIKKIKDELNGLNNELSLANRIKTETIAVAAAAPPAVVTGNTQATTVKEKPAAAVKEKPVAVNTPKKTEKPKAAAPVKKATSDNKPDYSPVTASTAPEAINKLDNLGSSLSVNDTEIFDFNSYQNPQAQSLKIEADARINDAAAQLKKLKDAIVISKSELLNPSSSSSGTSPTTQQLTGEADNMAVKAQALRSEADTKAGDEKDRLISEAKALEASADEKYIQASEVTSSDNSSVFNTNLDNIKGMMAAGKGAPGVQSEAAKLSEEAEAAFKQAVSIREEARSLTNAGAKLGSLSNAEEIESSAIDKQQQSLALLKKANPAFALKAPVTSTTQGAAVTNSAELNQKLKAVNEGINELAATKLASYQKLYDANTTEVDAVMASINANGELVDITPAFKTELGVGSGKIESAKTLKQNSDNAAGINEQLATLSAAIKKQLEGLKVLDKLNTSINKVLAIDKEALAARTKAAETKTTEALPEQQPSVTDPVVVETPPAKVPQEPATTEAAVNVPTINVSALSPQDSTAGQLVSYFNDASLTLRNEQAGTSVRKSLSDLKATGEEIGLLDEKIKNYQPPSGAAPVSPIELITKADALLVESEQVSAKASATRNEAASKTGAEQDTLMAQAKSLEQQSQDKKTEAATLYQQANASDYATNNNAITELMTKLKTDNPAVGTELEAKTAELLLLNEQTKKLREEADALPNPAARLGAISNAEEKEAELIQKQNQLISQLKTYYADYVVKPLGSENNETPEELARRKTLAQERQYAQLTGLTNAFSLEYETSKNSVPAKLNAEQKAIKQNADDLNTESKRLLIAATQEKNDTEKTKLLTLSAKAGNAAVEQLNKVIPEKPAVAAKTKPATEAKELDRIGNALAGKTPATPVKKTTPTPVVKAPPVAAAPARGVVKLDGLEVIKGNAYNDARPIPVDAQIENGLVFRVQIGAFKTRLANDAFKGLSPLNGETAGNGYIRYTAGNFNKVENANAVKNDLRRLGYNDAFVVVYYNGKRISLGEALEIMDKEGKTVDPAAPQSAGITAEANVPKVAPAAQAPEPAPQDNVVVTKELEQINGLLYTVQIGVYNKQITKRQLRSLQPIFTERLTSGMFRYTAGIYNTADRLINDKRRVVELGIKDAFVSAYLNGKRVPFSEGKRMQAEDSTVKMEAENPIVFPDAAADNAIIENTPALPPAVTASTVQPFKNNVSSYPAATEENGIKATEEGITFKVQIGAYSRQVPADIADKFSAITTWPVENKQINGLFIYNIGNFSNAKFAKALKEEALKLGIADAFVTVYRNGVKLYGDAASDELSR